MRGLFTVVIAALVLGVSASTPPSPPPTTSAPPIGPTPPTPPSPPPTTSAPPTAPTPATTAYAIHPNGNTAKCLDVRGAIYANGTPVQVYDCNGTGAQKWQLNPTNTQVRVAGTNFCLDAGSNPADAVGMKIWTCYNNLAAQSWYWTNDNRIALEGTGLCLDLTNGDFSNSNVVQTWQCTDFNNNQVWTPSALH